MSLENLQSEFIAMLQGAPALSALGNCPIEPQRSAALYQRNYRENHHNALALTYPSVLALSGLACFRQLAARYLAEHAVSSGDLNDYGGELPVFLERTLPTWPGAAHVPYLPDMARFDWAVFSALWAPAAPAADLFSLCAQPESAAEVCIHPHPACTLVRSQYAISDLWHWTHNQQQIVSSHPQSLLITRDDQVRVTPLSAASAHFVQHWLGGLTLAEALADLILHYPEADIAALFQQLNTLALASHFRSPSEWP